MPLKLKTQKITAFEMIAFYSQFATLIAAGIPIIETLDILASCTYKKLNEIILSLKYHLLMGNNLFKAMRHFPQHFSTFDIQLIHLGEQTGTLEKMLIHIVELHEFKSEIYNKTKESLFYPAVVLITAAALLMIFLIFIIPQFNELFSDNHNELPYVTKLIFAFSANIKKYISFIVIFILLTNYYLEPFRHLKRINVIKHILIHFNLIIFTKMLSIGLQAGLSIPKTIDLMLESYPNSIFNSYLITIRSKITSGFKLYQSLNANTVFPPFLLSMVKIGEEAGKLDELLEKTSNHLFRDLQTKIRRATQLLEPLIIILLGVLIGFIVLALYLPIFKLGNII